MAKRTKKPYFLWDYDYTEKDVRRMLKEGNETTKQWLTARILESAKYEDVWKYLTLKEILAVFPKLRLRKPMREAWEEAFKAWEVNYAQEDSHTTPRNIP